MALTTFDRELCEQGLRGEAEEIVKNIGIKEKRCESLAQAPFLVTGL